MGKKKIRIIVSGDLEPGDTDDALAKVMTELEEKGISKDEVIVISSGDMLSETETGTDVVEGPTDDVYLGREFVDFVIENTGSEIYELSCDIDRAIAEFEYHKLRETNIEEFKKSKAFHKPKIKNNNPKYGKHNKSFGGGNRGSRANIQFRGRR